MPSRFALTLLALASTAGGVLVSCGDGPTAPGDPPRVVFSVGEIAFGTGRDLTIELSNPGGRAVGPVQLLADPIRDEGGALVPASELQVSPELVPTLNPGSSVVVRLELVLPDGLGGGAYHSALEARGGAQGSVTTQVPVSFQVSQAPPPPSGPGGISIASGPASLRQGDVGVYGVLTNAGDTVPPSLVSWTTLPAGLGFFGGGGRFVPYQAGNVRIVALYGQAADTMEVDVAARGLSGSFQVVGTGLERDRYTSDLWLHGDVAYTGTWGVRNASGNTLFVWDVSQPTDPVRVDTLQVDARTVNDVKIRADGTLAVITHEVSNDGRNGVTLLSLADPRRPTVLTRFTQGLESGIHNVWIDGDYVYLVLDGVGNGLRVMDASDPTNPRIVASFYGGSSFLHDVYVRDGLAFLSHWDAGLVILDVGHGVAGGSPANPVEVGRVRPQGGNTHNAWYWPQEGYVFVGEENFQDPGVMHVVDVEDLSDPREVATFEVPGQTPHNFWLDEGRGVLYLAWYGNGIRALDVTGELLGDLTRQGREIAGLQYNGSSTRTWAPQLHRGLVYVSDMNDGLLVLDPPL